MNEAKEAEDKIEISTKDISKLIAILESLSNAAWAAAQSLKLIVKAGEGIERARMMMCSQAETKNKPCKETQERINALLDGFDY